MDHYDEKRKEFEAYILIYRENTDMPAAIQRAMAINHLVEKVPGRKNRTESEKKNIRIRRKWATDVNPGACIVRLPVR